MNTTVGQVAELVEAVDGAVDRMAASTEAISRAVTEQVTATNEIAQSIGGVTENSRKVSDRIASRSGARSKT
jgi:methyl-accepting chemotaxis protein